jgi:hypothetical protein
VTSPIAQRFKAVTTMSPLQYQKTLRLSGSAQVDALHDHGDRFPG